MTTFKTNLELGKRYTDRATGFTGTAAAIVFYEHGCERVTLKGINTNGEVVEFGFDAPELIAEQTQKPITTVDRKVGGPHGIAPTSRR